MPDITKCTNAKCPLRKNCFRFMAPPSDYQAYGDFQFTIIDGNAECEYYYPMKKEKTINNDDKTI